MSIRTEDELILDPQTAISETNWMIGARACEWLQNYARGRREGDYGRLTGLNPDQVEIRVRVWRKYGDVRGRYSHLFWSHFYAALEWEDAAECLTWASDMQATVAEMRAWRRAQRGDDLTQIGSYEELSSTPASGCLF